MGYERGGSVCIIVHTVPSWLVDGYCYVTFQNIQGATRLLSKTETMSFKLNDFY